MVDLAVSGGECLAALLDEDGGVGFLVAAVLVRLGD